jgi:hypothetical protein
MSWKKIFRLLQALLIYYDHKPYGQISAVAVSHGERTRRLIVPGSGQVALFTRRAIAPEGKQSRHTKNRVQSFEVVLRSLRRVYDGVAERHGRRTAGAPKALAVALSFCRLLGLGCPKQAFAKIATPRQVLFLKIKLSIELLQLESAFMVVVLPLSKPHPAPCQTHPDHTFLRHERVIWQMFPWRWPARYRPNGSAPRANNLHKNARHHA